MAKISQDAPKGGIPAVGDPFLLGINYWPRRKAMYWWKDFDPGEVREEFAIIKQTGINYVRFFLLWEDFQPSPDTVSQEQLRNLLTVADIAHDQNLLIEPTLFCGHMSGPNWAPEWLLSDQPRGPFERPLISGGKRVNRQIHNIYVTPEVVAAEEKLVRSVAERLKGHPALWAWSLGNEPDLFCQPPTPADGQAWTKRIVDLIHEIDPGRPVTIGLHTASLETDPRLWVNLLSQVTDFSVMHGYSIYAGWAKHPLDSDVVPFAGELTSALAKKPVLFEEFGLCTAQPGEKSHYQTYSTAGSERQQFFPSEEDGARYFEEVLPKLHQLGALGAFAWCYADYATDLWDRPPCDEFIHERFFGIVRPDGSLKPHAEVIRRFAALNLKIQPQNQAPGGKVALDVSPEEYYKNPRAHLERLFKKFSL